MCKGWNFCEKLPPINHKMKLIQNGQQQRSAEGYLRGKGRNRVNSIKQNFCPFVCFLSLLSIKLLMLLHHTCRPDVGSMSMYTKACEVLSQTH